MTESRPTLHDLREDVAKCLRVMAPGHRRQWYALVPLAAIGAATEALGAAGVFGLLTVLQDPVRAGRFPLVGAIASLLPYHDTRGPVVALTLLLVVFYVLRAAFLIASSYIHESVVQRTVIDVTSRLIRGYLEAPYPFYFHRNSMALLARAKDMAESAYMMVLSPAVHIVAECLIVAGLVGVLMTTVPAGSIGTVAAIGSLLLVPAVMSGRYFAKWGRAVKTIDLALRQDLQQSLFAIKDVKIAGRERFFYDKLVASRAALSAVLRRRQVMAESLRLSVETVFVIALLCVVLILVIGGRPGGEAVSLLGLLAYAGFRLVPSANRITAYLNVMRGAGVYIRDVYEDFVTLGAVDPTPMPAAAQADPARAFRTAVVFERVSYRYEDRSAPALDDVSLTIRKGESIGIVGQTGAGKSTFVDLLLGLLHPMSGRIVVDGVELGADARWWQRQLGYVPQTFAMIDDTLRRNIAFGFADREIDEQRLGAAVRMAQLDDVVAALPQALDTNMGERGIRLSGGQRQRIAIARALYRNPDVLIFDEATSSLDNQTEAEITRAIEALHHRLTVVVITHRLSTVRSCDRLVFLQGGRITAIGTFDQLVDTNAEFRAMATTTV